MHEDVKPRRVDAERNSARIVRAARTVWIEKGPDVPLDEIARRAGVGIATLYRHFPDKTTLARAALHQGSDEHLAPVTKKASGCSNPLEALEILVDAALSLAAAQRNILAVAADLGVLTAETNRRFVQALAEIAERGRTAGVFRDDLAPDDLVRVVVMLVSLQPTFPEDSEGWRRYFTLLLDGITRRDASDLPDAGPLPG